MELRARPIMSQSKHSGRASSGSAYPSWAVARESGISLVAARESALEKKCTAGPHWTLEKRYAVGLY